jgi:diguanylate cyclase (GGDEF)-like protein
MRIRDLLAQKVSVDVKCIRPESTLLETAQELRAHNIGALLVTDNEGSLAGVVSERDLVRALVEFQGEMMDKSVSDVMTRSVITCGPEDKIVDAIETMNAKNIRHIPVLDNGRVMAMISTREFDHAYKRLKAQARTDELTGLSNQRHFMEMLDNEFNRFRSYQSPLSVAVVGIDNLNRINDTAGHSAGDKVLNALADLLLKECRAYDSVGRISDEEFAIVFPSTDARRSNRACQRLLKQIRELEVDCGAMPIKVTVSIGLTLANTETRDCHELIATAHVRLAEAKAAGGDRMSTESMDPGVFAVEKSRLDAGSAATNGFNPQ